MVSVALLSFFGFFLLVSAKHEIITNSTTTTAITFWKFKMETKKSEINTWPKMNEWKQCVTIPFVTIKINFKIIITRIYKKEIRISFFQTKQKVFSLFLRFMNESHIHTKVKPNWKKTTAKWKKIKIQGSLNFDSVLVKKTNRKTKQYDFHFIFLESIHFLCCISPCMMIPLNTKCKKKRVCLFK